MVYSASRSPSSSKASTGGLFARFRLMRAVRERGGALGLSVGFGVFLSMLALYIGLMVYNHSQDAAADKLVESITAKEQEIDPDKLKAILLLDSRFKNVRALLKNHVISSRIFSLLENNTFPQISYSTFLFDSKKGTVDLAGLTTSFALLAKQIAQFEHASDAVSAVTFGNPDKTEKGVKFTIMLTLKPQFYKL